GEGGGEIVPVDSEHSAVLQCITGRRPGELARLILTASGGPFRTWNPERVAGATVDEALRHPTWKMGKKITVDSATLVNKALEVIEAHFLFGLTYDAVEVVVHPQPVVHAFVEFVDGSVLAQVGFPTMELPILYALTHPDRVPDAGARRFDPVAAGTLTFEPVRAALYRRRRPRRADLRARTGSFRVRAGSGGPRAACCAPVRGPEREPAPRGERGREGTGDARGLREGGRERGRRHGGFARRMEVR